MCLLIKSLAAVFVDFFFKSVYVSSKKVDNTLFRNDQQLSVMAWSKGLPPLIPTHV